jgi:Putative Flp pilus-assembly TadE/G-like
MLALLRRFAGSKSGNFSQIAALLTVPLVGAIGLAVDYSHALEVRNQLYEAADAAAVGSIADSSPAYDQTALMEDDGPVPAGEEDALNLFNANVSSAWAVEVSAVKAEVKKAGADLTAKVSFTARIPMTFMRIFGYEYLDVQGEATSARRTAPFIDFYLLLDNTPSMGVGATTGDISRMVANTPDKCAFACHDLSKANNYYTLAKQLDVAMRIDVVREATQQMMDTAVARRAHANQFRMALYTFGDAATNRQLTKLAPLTSDLKKVNEAADAVDLMTIPYQNFDSDQLTDFDGTFAALDKEIDKPGNGTSTKDRQKVVFFVSDGVADSYKPADCSKLTTKGRCQEPIDVDDCTRLKDRGIRIAVLYTTYLPLPTNAWYNTWIKPFQGQIATNMSACASPGYFFEVSPSEGISEAMEALFMKVISVPRLTG